MFYNREEKELLGRYFKYYREQSNIPIKQITSAGICEYRAYKRIEEGKSSNEELIDSLLKYFNIDDGIVEILRKINPLINELYDACEWYDNEKINKIIQIIKHQTYHYSSYPLIIELRNTLEIIKRQYISNEYLNEQEIYETFKLIELWNNQLSSLLIEVCGISNTNYIFSNEVYNLMNGLSFQENSICNYWKARLYIVDVNYVKAIEIYKFLIEYYTSNKNYIRKIRVKMRLFNIYRDIDHIKADSFANILMNELNNEIIPNQMKSSIYYNLGMYYYLNNDYTNALFNFEKSNEIENGSMTTLFICSIKSRLNLSYSFKIKTNENDTNYLYLKYYEMKFDKLSPRKLEDYILSNLVPLLMNEKYEYPLWDMFNYETSQLVKETRNYKKYHEFQEKMQFATKNTA